MNTLTTAKAGRGQEGEQDHKLRQQPHVKLTTNMASLCYITCCTWYVLSSLMLCFKLVCSIKKYFPWLHFVYNV